MDARNTIDNIHNLLINTEDKSLFAIVSPIHYLTHPPIPLNTAEMHSVSGDMIRKAKREVLLEFYKFSNDSDGGKEIYLALEDLKAKAEREKMKINVCMLVNSRGTLAESFYKANTSINLVRLESSEYFNIKLTLHPTAAFGTLHTKMIIVDSEIAMIRGGDPDDMNNLSRELVETATLLQGAIVSEMRSDYNDVWKAYCNEPLPDIQPLDEVTNVNADSNLVKPLSIPCIFLSKRENGNPISPYYTYSEGPYKLALLQTISNASTSINIMTSNLNDTNICDALAAACFRGVSVNIVTGMHHNDSTESWWGGTNFDSLAYLVSKIDSEYQNHLSIRWATNLRGDIVGHGDKFTIHAKYVCIDNELVFVGSSPLDVQGMKYSREADIIFLHGPTAETFDVKFFNDKFNLGKEYFEEAYFRIRNQIELQTIRIDNSANTTLRINKAKYLREALNNVSTQKCFYREKLYLLLESTLPILQVSTGSKPGMPASYNAIMANVTKYGLANHIKIEAQNLQLELENEELINNFYFIPSNSSHRQLRKRASSDIQSTSPNHENKLKKSM